MQDNNTLLDAVERYIRGEMLPEERRFFEHVRTSNPEVDQLVIEHTLFLKQFTQYGETARLKAKLHDVHEQLSETGEIGEGRPALVVTLWKKYKKVVFVAASIAGITALFISGLVSILSPKVSPDKVDYLMRVVNGQNAKINNIANAVNTKEAQVFDGSGTGF